MSGLSVVIPSLNPGRHLPDLLPSLLEQKPRPPDEIILVDSGSTDGSLEIAARFEAVRVISIERFSHGGSRNLGVREARGEIVVCMTQDALPRDPDWLAMLIEPLQRDPTVAATYSRQVPYPDAPPMERFFLNTYFPPGPPIRRERGERETIGLRDAFFSNVSAAYRRDLLLQYPFDEALVMSEDQQVSRDFQMAGYAVEYCPDSVVLHSHNYPPGAIFRRYFDSLHSLRQIFPEHSFFTSFVMGQDYLRHEFRHMLLEHPILFPRYLLFVAARSLGTLAGHAADWIPGRIRPRLSMHGYYWKQYRRGNGRRET